jgi:hypothetical protein
MAAIDYLGWTATGVFVGSYFCRTPRATRHVQMLGALLWLTYGLLIGALPVVAANALVFGAAAWTAGRQRPEVSHGPASSGFQVQGSRFAG